MAATCDKERMIGLIPCTRDPATTHHLVLSVNTATVVSDWINWIGNHRVLPVYSLISSAVEGGG